MKEEEKQASDLPEAASFPPPHTNRRKAKRRGSAAVFFGWWWLGSSAGLKFARHSLSAVGNKGSPSVSPCGAGGGLKGREKNNFPGEFIFATSRCGGEKNEIKKKKRLLTLRRRRKKRREINFFLPFSWFVGRWGSLFPAPPHNAENEE